MSNSKVSVIINTNDRCTSLMKVVAALEWQRYPDFELCLVVGPAEDGSAAYAEELAAEGRIKMARCAEANLSVSRNIGLDLAAGELVAFLDDDALPEPVWLEHLVAVFTRSDIGGASGLVFQPNGREHQFRYSFCDRFGATTHVKVNDPSPSAYPLSPVFPHVMGANCMFRRADLAAIGGFDEQYEYYLDEADVCCRLIDAGREIVHADWAPVHHKYLSGATRDGAGVTVRRGAIVKNQIYFSLKNARGHASLREILDRSSAFADWHRDDLVEHVIEERLPGVVLDEFDLDAESAWETGLSCGLAHDRRLRISFAQPDSFRPFPRRLRDGARHIAVICAKGTDGSKGEPPSIAEGGDILRWFEIAASEVEGVDFIDSAWHHRISPAMEVGSATEIDNAIRSATKRVAAYFPFNDIVDMRRAHT